MRYRRLLFTTPALAALLALPACGSEQAAGPSDSATTSVQPTRSPADRLTVEVRASANATPTTWTLTCGPAGGDHPKAAKACEALGKAEDPFKPVPKDQIWRGRQVDAGFNRKNGCEMHRWDQVEPLFGDTVKRD